MKNRLLISRRYPGVPRYSQGNVITKGKSMMNQLCISLALSGWLLAAAVFAQVRELPAPAGPSSGQPNLAVSPMGRVYLSALAKHIVCLYDGFAVSA
jgi:hypothetical protein